MSVDIDKMKIRAASGLSPVCASCRHYERARDEGLPEPQCLSPGPCGSPIAGLTFPFYDGPMAGGLTRWCFMCGAPAVLALVVEGRLNEPIGICAEDVITAQGLDPVKLRLFQKDTPVRRVFVKGPHGDLVPLENFGVVRRNRPSLLQTMKEVDQRLAEGKKL